MFGLIGGKIYCKAHKSNEAHVCSAGKHNALHDAALLLHAKRDINKSPANQYQETHKYAAPISMTAIAIASVVAPSALPIFNVRGVWNPLLEILSRKSCAMVTPTCAYAEAVRTYARKVRSSACSYQLCIPTALIHRSSWHLPDSPRWSLLAASSIVILICRDQKLAGALSPSTGTADGSTTVVTSLAVSVGGGAKSRNSIDSMLLGVC